MISMVMLGAICFLTTLALQPLLIRVLPMAGVVDVPNSRSSHEGPTPRGGGIGALAALAVAAALWHPPPAGIAIATAVAFGAVGWIDDVRPLTSGFRLSLQFPLGFGASLMLVGWGWGAWWLVPIGMLLLAGFVNSFNFMDGVNGMSGLNAVVMGTAFFLLGNQYAAVAVMGLGVITACCALGFLPFNLAGRIFLGDVGSYLFGGVIGATFIIGVCSGIPVILMASPLVIYLVDTVTTVIGRAHRGEGILEAHRSHIYQRVAATSAGHIGASVWVAMSSATVVASAWIAVQYSAAAGVLLGLAAVAAFIASPILSRGICFRASVNADLAGAATDRRRAPHA